MILHLDVDAFFASVEQLKDPRLKGRPVAVGNGVVASPSYEARARGVLTAMPIQQARRICPELVVLDGRQEVYRCFTDAIWEVCRRYAPALETFLDEAFADFTGTEHAIGDPLALGGRIRREVREETGLAVTVGIGRNRMLSKLAAKSVKPDGLRLLRPEEEEAFLLGLPIGKIPGMGPKTAALFADMNVRTVAEFRAIPRATLEGMLGRVGGALWERARGRDTRPVTPRELPKSVSRETTLEQPTADRGWLEGMLGYLLERAMRAVRQAGLRARTLRVRLRYADGEEAEGATSFGATAYDAELQPAARALLGRLYARRVSLRFVGVALSNLEPDGGQLLLFGDPALERRTAALDAVRDRHGHGAVVSGRAIALLNSLPADAYGYVLRTPSLTK